MAADHRSGSAPGPSPRPRPKPDCNAKIMGFFTLTCFIGLAAAFVFVSFPQVDLAVSGWFYLGKHQFWAGPSSFANSARSVFEFGFVAACAVALLGAALSIFKRRQFLGFGFPHWLFLALALIVGPGLIANTVFKDHWGRARPFYVQQFGGHERFTPVLERSDQCASNCSFVSGEAASIFALFFALAFMLPAYRSRLLAGGLVAGGLIGLIRIAGGGHFLSDVVFAGVSMALVVCGLYWLIFDLAEPHFAESGPVHRRLHLAARLPALGLRRALRRRRRASRPAALPPPG
jgi:lipid A 4'-phosphatase